MYLDIPNGDAYVMQWNKVGSVLYELKIIVNLFIGQSRGSAHDVTVQLLLGISLFVILD